MQILHKLHIQVWHNVYICHIDIEISSWLTLVVAQGLINSDEDVSSKNSLDPIDSSIPDGIVQMEITIPPSLQVLL